MESTLHLVLRLRGGGGISLVCTYLLTGESATISGGDGTKVVEVCKKSLAKQFKLNED